MFIEHFLSASRRFFTGTSAHNTSASSNVPAELSQDITADATQIEPAPKLSFRADSRLLRARNNVPGVYRLYRKGGAKIIFKVWSVCHHETGRQLVRIFPISSYDENGKLIEKIDYSTENTNAFFPRSILFGVLDIDRVPLKYRMTLEYWTPLFKEGVAQFEEGQLLHNNNPIDQ